MGCTPEREGLEAAAFLAGREHELKMMAALFGGSAWALDMLAEYRRHSRHSRGTTLDVAPARTSADYRRETLEVERRMLHSLDRIGEELRQQRLDRRAEV